MSGSAGTGTAAFTQSIAAAARHFRRDNSERSAKLDAIIALSIALDRAKQRPEPVRLVGWL